MSEGAGGGEGGGERRADRGDPGEPSGPGFPTEQALGFTRVGETGQRLAPTRMSSPFPTGQQARPWVHVSSHRLLGGRRVPGWCGRPGPAVLRPQVPKQLWPQLLGHREDAQGSGLGKISPQTAGRAPQLPVPTPRPSLRHPPARSSGGRGGPRLRGVLLGSDLAV